MRKIIEKNERNITWSIMEKNMKKSGGKKLKESKSKTTEKKKDVCLFALSRSDPHVYLVRASLLCAWLIELCFAVVDARRQHAIMALGARCAFVI